MRRFIDRLAHRATLETAWRSGRPELVVLHGRRRVGKSELLVRFARDKPIAYYVAAQQLERDQLTDLGRALGPLSTGFRPGRPPRLAFRDWEELLAVVAEAAKKRRIGLVLDEFPYLTATNAALPSLIQRWWDSVGSKSDLVLVLAGSQQAMMQRLVSANGALYGRPTQRLHLQPFDYYHAGQFVPRWSPEDRVRLYAVAGGIPDYLEEFDDGSPLRDELKRLAFSPDGRLFREAPDLLRSEFTEPRTYESVIRAIAQGATTPGEVADRAGLPGANRVNPYLDRLHELGLVDRRVPPVDATKPRPRTSQWILADSYLRFYYAFVDPWRSAIQLGSGSAVLDEILDEQLDLFVSRTFEQVAREYVIRLSATGAIPPLSMVAFWWYPGGDLDVAGLRGSELAVAGSVTWTNDYVKPGDLSELRKSVATVAPGDRPLLFLFSRSGFDRHLRKELQVRLVTLSELFAKALDYEADGASAGAPGRGRRGGGTRRGKRG